MVRYRKLRFPVFYCLRYMTKSGIIHLLKFQQVIPQYSTNLLKCQQDFRKTKNHQEKTHLVIHVKGYIGQASLQYRSYRTKRTTRFRRDQRINNQYHSDLVRRDFRVLGP